MPRRGHLLLIFAALLLGGCSRHEVDESGFYTLVITSAADDLQRALGERDEEVSDTAAYFKALIANGTISPRAGQQYFYEWRARYLARHPGLADKPRAQAQLDVKNGEALGRRLDATREARNAVCADPAFSSGKTRAARCP
jgi:hypothetical protein